MKFKKYIDPSGFEVKEMDEVLEFHDVTKVKPYSSLRRSVLVNAYLESARGVQETSRNYNVFLSSSTEQLRMSEMEEFNPLSIGETVRRRYSCREFDGGSIADPSKIRACLGACCETRVAVAQLDGKTKLGFRGYASPGGLYPIEIYLLEKKAGSEWALYYLEAKKHQLRKIKTLSDINRLSGAVCEVQRDLIATTHGAVILTAVWERCVVKYGYQGYRFALVELGIVAHHISLIMTSIGLDNLHWGSFYDDMVGEIMGLDPKTESVGHVLWYGNAKE